MFGPHLIIDGSRCDTRKLADRNLVEQVLTDYPTAIGMTKIGGPYMFEYQAPDPAYSGVSGLVVIAESHIAIHTFPELDYFTMDIFSCKNFDHEKAIDYIRTAFDVKEMDRMLVQRGLSFKGPHHGKLGATDELIAAADARLAAGIISKEPALPDELPGAGMAESREAALARHAIPEGATDAAGGRMIWPRYGVSPDYGTYGDAACEPCDARGGATVVALNGSNAAPRDAGGKALLPSEPVQVNPTASISGLLDKMTATGRQGRALGRALVEWERLVRGNATTIALTLSQPVIADGMRELLVYAVEHRYVDVVIASADDFFADLYEALGYVHYADGEAMVAVQEGREKALAFFAEFLASTSLGAGASVADLWTALGASLGTHVPRKGLLQAAARAGVRIFTPDLSTSAFGGELLAARARGAALSLDASTDIAALARALAAHGHVGVVQVGSGAAGAMLMRARAVAGALGLEAPAVAGCLALGGTPVTSGEHSVAVAADASLALPLLVTGLAQRHPHHRVVATDTAIQAAEAEAAIA